MSTVVESARRLIAAIDAIARANAALGDLATEQRRAIARMDGQMVQGIVARQRAAGYELADSEESRRREVGVLCRALALPSSAGLKDIARAVAAHDRELGQALRSSADAARKAILDCQREQRVVQAAATGVMAHLDGLARQVLASVNRAGLYAATGAMACSATPRGVDLVS